MAKKIETVTEAVIDAAGNEITANLSLVVYPTDVWGLTSQMKQAMEHVAARVCGSDDKYQLVQDTLKICEEYLRVRYLDDKARLNA